MPERNDVTVALTIKERDTILAALRYYEGAMMNGFDPLADDGLRDIATNGYTHESLDEFDINSLCEKLNVGLFL